MTVPMETKPPNFASQVAKRAFLLFIGCALIPISVLTFVAIRQVTVELRDQSERQLRRSSKAVGLELHQRILALDSAIGQREGESSPRDGLRRRFIGVQLVTKEGMSHPFSGQTTALPPLSPEQLKYLATGQTLLSTGANAKGEMRFFLARALDPKNPTWAGGAILYAEIDPAYVWAVEDDSMLDRDTALTVLNESGTVLFSSPLAPPLSAELTDLAQKTAAGQFTWNTGGKIYLASYWSLFLKNQFLEPKWIIVLNRKTNDIFAPIGMFRRTFLLVSLLSLLVVLWLSSVQIRKILSPLTRLQTATSLLALGRLDTRVEVKSGDEFEDLAASFNQMASQLSRQFEALTMRTEITLALSRNEPTPAVLNACMEIISRHLRIGVAGVWLLRDRQTALERYAVHAATPFHDLVNGDFPVGLAAILRVATEGRPFATNAMARSRGNPDSAAPGDGGSLAFAGHPLVIDGRVQGVAAVFASRPLDVIDLASAASAAGEIAQGIARRRSAEALRESEEQVRQLQKTEAVGRLAAGIAHDFNNLLTVIMGYSQMLTMGFEREDPRMENAQVIEKTAVRASQLTQQLLAFSRKQVLSLAVVDLNALVKDMMSLLHRLIGASVEIIFKPSVEIPLMEVDRGQIEQVIVNLVVNARDAMPDGGSITIETHVVELEERSAPARPETSHGKQVVLKVTDTGTGMDSATQSKIFEPFFTTKEPGKGTGLGLATVFGIVTQSRGTVRVESEIGRGTSFTFHFPVATGPMEKAGPLEPRSVLGGNETILVVEDEQEMRTLLEKILRSRGYQVLTAARPSDALRIADEYKATIHLLLTDMVMPEMNGAILSARIKIAHPEIAIVQMSGYSGYDDETSQSGKIHAVFLQKPFTPDTVARVVREALDSKS